MSNRATVLRKRMLALGLEIAGVVLVEWAVHNAMAGAGSVWLPALVGVLLIALGILLFFGWPRRSDA